MCEIIHIINFRVDFLQSGYSSFGIGKVKEKILRLLTRGLTFDKVSYSTVSPFENFRSCQVKLFSRWKFAYKSDMRKLKSQTDFYRRKQSANWICEWFAQGRVFSIYQWHISMTSMHCLRPLIVEIFMLQFETLYTFWKLLGKSFEKSLNDMKETRRHKIAANCWRKRNFINCHLWRKQRLNVSISLVTDDGKKRPLKEFSSQYLSTCRLL